MNDRVLVQALRADDPGALAALFDSHAESIYRYCWSLLRHSDNAQVALRDTFIAAHAHAGSLSDPSRLRPWLYALARRECLRRRLAAPAGDAGDAGAEEARPGTGADADLWADAHLWAGADADLRVMAWNATRSLPAAGREILELSAVHGLSARDVAAVLGMPPRQVETARDEARRRLRDAVTAEVLAAKGPYDCKVRAAVLTGFTGRLTPRMREELVQHLPECATCSPHHARQVSESKVFELLPPVTVPGALKVRVLSYFADPELTPYRRYVARRSGALDAGGFPLAADRKARRWPHALACALAAVATVVALGVIFTSFGGGPGGLPGVASAALPTGPVVHLPSGPPTAPDARAPGQQAPDGSRAAVQPVANASPAYPVGMVHSSVPASPPTAWPTHGSVATSAAATPPRTPPGKGTPSLTPPADPGGPPDGRPREHQSRGPGGTPCPTGKPTRTPPPRPTRTPRPTPSATPPVTAKPTATPTPTPTATTTAGPTTSAPAPTSSGSTAP
ncbi:sigma factor-like helix-turn-helix DNA-binding protein [Nonomuraea sp. NPDC047897]|uniref:RNA polymerase sigma factor n=1 Tax=Nonomuraea sp. NPDC047897 TaxID=3364346 RepID=UPI003715EEDC